MVPLRVWAVRALSGTPRLRTPRHQHASPGASPVPALPALLLLPLPCLGDPSCRCVPWLDHLCTSLLTQLPRDPPLACASCQKLHMYQPPVCEHTFSKCAEWHVSECLSQRMLCVRNCVTGCTCDVSHVTWQPSSGEKSYRQVSRKPFAEGFPAASWELPTGSPGPWKEPSKGHSPATGPRPSGNLLNENSQRYVSLCLPP